MPRDLRFALRRLARSPAFAAAAVTCLALGIGANTAIFSVINAVLLRSLPYEEPERLVGVWEANHFRRSERNVVSPANYLDWQSGTSSFSRMAAVHDIGANLTGAGEPEEVRVQRATAGLFDVLGLRAAVGRTFVPADDTPGGPEIAVLSHGLWARRFSADPSVVGSTIRLDGVPLTVIGVMPPGTQTIGRQPRPDLWVPMRLDPAVDYREESGRYLQAVARLRPGASLERAQARERPDLAVVAGGAAGHDGVRMDQRVGAERAIRDDGVGPDVDAVVEHDFACEHDADVDEDVAANRHLAADVDALGIGERRAACHEIGCLHALPRPLGGRKLRAVVDAEHLGRRFGDDTLDADFVCDGHRDDVGQVVLALRVVVLQVAEVAAQRRCVIGHDAGVDLRDAALVVVGVLVLDDASDCATRVT